MRRFWYFDVSKWSGENFLYISMLNQIGGLASARLNPVWTEPLSAPKRLPSSFGIPKIPPRYNKTLPQAPPRHPQTAPDTIDKTIHIQTFKMIIWCVRIWGVEQGCNHQFILAQHWNAPFFPTWSFWDIKIPKQPHKSFLKIIGLSHFLQFLGSSERYCLLQLLLITL